MISVGGKLNLVAQKQGNTTVKARKKGVLSDMQE